MKTSKFHQQIRDNREAIIRDYVSMTKKQFMKKYNVGYDTMKYYLWGIQKGEEIVDDMYVQRIARKLVKQSKNETGIAWRTARLFRIVSMLLKEYSEKEIVNWKFTL